MNRPEPETEEIVGMLAVKALEIAGARTNEIDRYCWMVVHEYRHGSMPAEYDIRDIDEALYLNVLRRAKKSLA